MKNVTFRVEDEILLQKAKSKALSMNRSLNDLFIDWLKNFSNEKKQTLEYRKYFQKYSHIKIEKSFTRNEMNER